LMLVVEYYYAVWQSNSIRAIKLWLDNMETLQI